MDQETVTNACRKDAGKLLKSKYKQIWSPENPTFGYCYIVSEALFHYAYPKHKPFVINLGVFGTHWYLDTPQRNDRIDFTADQFRAFDITRHYEKSKCCGFFKGSVQTERGYISKAGYAMAQLLGLV